MRLTLWLLGVEVFSVSTDTPNVDWILPLDWQDDTDTEDDETWT